MTALLDLIDEHRGAVKYDLLRHGYRLDWLATPRLPWGDAVTIIAQQPRVGSAVHRVMDGDEHRDERDLLELLAVLLVRGHKVTAMNEVPESDMPHQFSDLFDKKTPEPEKVQLTLLSFEEIDQRMGMASG